jgi:choline dehydrogenase-like flavoprotein
MTSEELEYDVAIIGSGSGGGSLAWRLSETSTLRIICLEQGDYALASSFPTNFEDWEIRKESAYSYNPKVRNNLADYEVDDSQSPIKIANYNGVGGSTVLFSGHFPRMHPSDFKVFELDGIANDWPISYQDLAPYYNLIEKFVEVSGLTGDPAYPPIPSLSPPVPLGPMGEMLAKGFNELGWHWWPSYSAINTSNRNSRGKCINLGPCNSGCAQGAKGSVDTVYWPKSLANGVELRTLAQVTKLNLNHNESAVESVVYRNPDNTEVVIKAKIFVIACNGIGTPRLLLSNKTSRFKSGISNSSGLVGKNLMLHPLGYIEGRVEKNVSSSIGPQGCCILSQEFYETDKERDFYRGFTIQVLRSSGPIETTLRGLERRQISFGPTFYSDFKKRFNKTLSFSVIAEDLPEESNQVYLKKQSDKFGIPIPAIEYQISENTKRILSFATRSGKRLLKHIGAKDVVAHAPISFAGWHLMGTARMGSSARSSVTDQNGKCHDLENLYIADGSLFVTSGSVNPALTIQALAAYIADGIIKRLDPTHTIRL